MMKTIDKMTDQEIDDTERYIREGIKDYPLFNNNID